MSRRNILLVAKLAIRCFFINFCKLLLSTNEVLYLQKQPLVSTLQKQLLLILTNIFAVLWSLPEIVCFLWSTSVVLLEYFFGGKGVFNHFQALNTSTKFWSSFDFCCSWMFSKSLACRLITHYMCKGSFSH